MFGGGDCFPAFLELNIDPQDAVLEVRRYVGDAKSICVSKTWCVFAYRDQIGALLLGAECRELDELSFGPALTDDEIRRRAQAVPLPFTPAWLKELRVTECANAFVLDFVVPRSPDEDGEGQSVRICLGSRICSISDPSSSLPTWCLEHRELSPIEIAELAGIVSQYRVFRDETPDTELAEFRERLRNWSATPVWIGKRMVPVGEQLIVFLSEGEKCCSEMRFEPPYRDGTAHVLSKLSGPPPAWTYAATTLGDLIKGRLGIQALYRRLDEDCIANYRNEDLLNNSLKAENLQFQTIWAWENNVRSPTALLCAPMPDVPNGPSGEFPVVIPSAWGKPFFSSIGDLRIHKDQTLVVSNAQGLYGVVKLRELSADPLRMVGEWVVSCSWAYLSGGRDTPSRLIEASRTITPDSRGELVCDLMDPSTGEILNPPGCKVLMGSTDHDGYIAVNEAGQGAHERVLGQLNMQGVLYCGQAMSDDELVDVPWSVDNLRWLEIGSRREGMTAVRSAENGLWGFVDRAGALAIPAQYADVWSFDEELAPASPANSQLWGLIDHAGQWAMAPKWLDLERWEKDLIVVEAVGHLRGAVDDAGNTLVDFKPWEEWLAEPDVAAQLAEYQVTESAWPKDLKRRQRQEVIDAIRVIAKKRFREKARQRLDACTRSLAPMEGVFGAGTSERDLRETGIWGKQVRLLADKTDGILEPKKGEVGRIGCYYPVTLSVFDLSVEAPVNGLPTKEDAAIGIRWRDLALVDSEQSPESADQASGWQRLKQGVDSATNISAYLLGSIFLFVRMGVVGIALHVILNGIYHIPLVSAVPGFLCAGYLLLVAWKVGQNLLGTATETAGNVFVEACAASSKFLWWNLGAFTVWVLLVLSFKGQVDPWFTPVWALVSSVSVLKMAHAIWNISSLPEKPEWPAAIFDEMKAEFCKEIEEDGENGPCEITCLRSRYYMFLAGLVADYADRYPAVAFYEEEIAKRLDEIYQPKT